jgi:hypothetical protein
MRARMRLAHTHTEVTRHRKTCTHTKPLTKNHQPKNTHLHHRFSFEAFTHTQNKTQCTHIHKSCNNKSTKNTPKSPPQQLLLRGLHPRTRRAEPVGPLGGRPALRRALRPLHPAQAQGALGWVGFVDLIGRSVG